MKEGTEVLSAVAEHLDRTFEGIGLGFIPPVLRYVAVILFLSSPLIGICYVLIFEEDNSMAEAKKRVEG